MCVFGITNPLYKMDHQDFCTLISPLEIVDEVLAAKAKLQQENEDAQ